MLTANRELMQQARAALKGKWGLAVAGNLIYLVLIAVGQFIPIIRYVSTLILAGPLLLGLTAFFLALSRKQEAALSQIFDGFQRFVDALVTYLWMALFIFLWFLLLIVPGIMVALSYALTFFLMAEDPTLKGREALQKSKALMDGHRWRLFCLFLRFLGWFLLGALTFGIGFLWIIPYLQTSMARFYDDLRENGSGSDVQEQPKPAPRPAPQPAPPASPKPLGAPPKPQPAQPSAPVPPPKPPVNARARICLRCHEPIPDPEAKFCPSCGFSLEALEVPASPKAAVPEFKPVQPVSPPSPPSSPPPPIQPLRLASEDLEVTMMVRGPRLSSLSPEGQKETYDLKLPVVKIGRSPDNNLAFPNERTISGHHCEIVREGKNFFIRDLGSTNGVIVNQQKVASSILAEADEIRLGDKIFTFTFLG